MSNTNPFDQSELIRLALVGLDTQIAGLQEKRAQLASLSNEQLANTVVKATMPKQKTGKMSDEAKAKISAAAKKRWAKVKKAKAEAAKLVTVAKNTPAKKKSVKAQSATKGKKAPSKKGKTPPVEGALENAAN